MTLAPVALFVYNRADHTRRTLRHLIANTLAPQTEVYVFADGGRDEASWRAAMEVRAAVREVQAEVERTHGLKRLTLVERPVNFYLERNVIEGIGQVLAAHETIIVLEDDICTAPHFLEYINRALALYRDDRRVMHVSGFTHLDLLADHPDWLADETYFTPFMAGWGWATWRDRWQPHFRHYQSRAEAMEGLGADDVDAMEYGGIFPCLKHLDRQPIPWDICWGLAIHRAGGLCLQPAHTLVRNIGLDAGTHFRALRWGRWDFTPLLQRFSYDRPVLDRPLRFDRRTPAADPRIEAAFAEAIRDWGIRYTWLGRIVRRAYHLIS